MPAAICWSVGGALNVSENLLQLLDFEGLGSEAEDLPVTREHLDERTCNHFCGWI
jgi:hypothetical protein